MSITLSVIIPFYQKKSGILRRTLLSVLSQGSFNKIEEIVIIDDGSPVTAESETSNLSEKILDKITIISNKNGGVSNARNCGLNYLVNKTNYVAFLDSDDIWLPMHVSNIISAFELGAEFYFSNFYQLKQKVSAFDKNTTLNYTDHKLLKNDLYLYASDMKHQILTSNLIGTPTVAFNIRKFSTIRFRENLHYAGEDYIFWLDVTSSNCKTIFCKTPSVKCEEGENIFSSATWGTFHLHYRLADEIYFRKEALQRYNINSNTENILMEKLNSNRKSVLGNAINLVRNSNFKIIPLIAKLIKDDPAILAAYFK